MATRTTASAAEHHAAPAAGGVRLPTPPALADAATAGPADPADLRTATFKEAMSRFASGVVLVTGTVGGRPWGMTVSACCCICTTPPTMLVSLAAHTALAASIEQTGRFGINVLGQETVQAARFGSRPGTPKFLDEAGDELEWAGDPAAAAIGGALSHLDCDVAQVVEEGTHRLFLGRVREVVHAPQDEPLLYFHRDFRRLEQAA
jgi:flavin reductase (DIM6/NTAB) family NADH-FMN oxidoreductase RutF